MQFSVIASVALSIASAQAYTLVISRDGAIFSKTLATKAEYATIYDGVPGVKVYTVGDAAGSAAFYGEAATTSEEAAETTPAAAETTPAAAETTPAAAETTPVVESTESSSAVESTKATSVNVAYSSVAGCSNSSFTSVSVYEGAALTNGVNVAFFGGVAAVAALLI